MTNIMIYDSEIDLDLDYFCKFKNLKIVDFKSFVANIKEFWSEAELVIDGTSKGQLFNKACAEKKSFVFYKESNYAFYKNKKVISIPDLRVVEFNKNKDNFSQEHINKFSKEVNLINSILEMTCSSYVDFLEKEIEELSKPININSLTSDENEDYYFVSDKTKEIVPNGNVIDFNSLMILKELKEIFAYQF